jgi:hypothetical protein
MRRFLPLGSRVQSGNVPQRQDRGPDMIRLLSAVGRATVIVVAVLTIVGFAIGGYGMGTGEYHGSFASAVPQGAGGVVGAVVGAIVGIIVAGAVFGPIATLYDIRDNIRRMAAPRT